MSNMERGPEGYENWRKALQGVPKLFGKEVQLFSDAHVTGEVCNAIWGPFDLLNTIAIEHPPGCLPVLVLRVIYHSQKNVPNPDLSVTDESVFHGGGIEEEISSLLGLRLGIRLRPGGSTRDILFEPYRERPRALNVNNIPVFSKTNFRHPVLPRMDQQVCIRPDILEGYLNINPKSAVALVRAARLFQHALWLSEANPNDAWLMLVSAVEVAAIDWVKSEGEKSAEDIFRELKPDWADRLDRTGDTKVVKDMAEHWIDLLKSTKRFCSFLMHFLPDPPPLRPSEYCQIKWGPSLKKLFFKIYDYRSKALHAGIPFPSPMCCAPIRIGPDELAESEKPFFLASASNGGVWTQDDTPIQLHVFKYIVEGSLNKWWDKLKGQF